MTDTEIKPGRYVLVTTDETRRGVFMGKLVTLDWDAKFCELEEAQMCVFWHESMRGVDGLSSKGPNSHCRIGPVTPRKQVDRISSVTLCCDKAVERWKEEPWG